MNYNLEQNPKYVNQRIQDYIDTVMHPQCKTQTDKWTIDSMVSWERFGPTICNACYENRERLHKMVNGFKNDYDTHSKGTLWLDRKTTPYSEVPYVIRGTCELIGMKLFNTIQSTYGIQIFTNTNGWNSWDMNSIYMAGQTAFLASSHAWTYSDPEIEITNSKIDQLVCSWNLNVLLQKNTALESKVASLKTQIQQLETSNNLNKFPYV